jgi:hypothetical protein
MQWPKSASALRKRTIGSSLAADVQTVDARLYQCTTCRGDEKSTVAHNARVKRNRSRKALFCSMLRRVARTKRSIKTVAAYNMLQANNHMMARTTARKKITFERLAQ